ncbi:MULTISPECIES: acyl carrier protein [unclassified Cocleimonas]|uniref:acyl carrier protein n=1 Tax=unclassified Cocleimonas TaxID=2639732 RepID=UPI002618BCDC|nr:MULTISPECIES: acyl carrier protein [unclassified Cocleimonas]MEB8432451.1 acyl carrier protein [Cocleimonas sp. KMM 6892]MEC4715310.1 acyl carrier protein [Cocleimonas sp. KMM 6895]MEC4745071.1 acyl carrier protein [Cocleimonas sp. KMM 6896]
MSSYEQSYQQTLQQLKEKLIELFELEEAELVADARLYQDLDIDSIDTVDLMVELKKHTGKDLSPKLFKDARTIDDVVKIIVEI